MKLFFLILVNFLLFNSYSQQYNGVYIEKNKVDSNNKIYKVGKIFNFNSTIDGKEYVKIKMIIEKSNLFNRTNKNQTEIKYIYYPTFNIISNTGLVENDKNIWIHPPRVEFFKSLETCPFPYLMFGKTLGYKWEDKMMISDYWSNAEWGVWNGKLLLNYTYEIVGSEFLKLKIGEVECLKIHSSAQSTIGTSYLDAYFSPEYGFVKLD